MFLLFSSRDFCVKVLMTGVALNWRGGGAPGVCAENLSSDVVVVKSAKDGV
jgi:hypothetical protein